MVYYASREDMARSSLLFKRYKMREELDKIEPVRHGILWYELSHIITAANDWQVYPIYRRIARKTKTELTPEILRLSEEIMKSAKN